MAFPISPGVNTNEINLTTIIPAVSTTVGAIAGVFRWGPVGVPVLVNDENDLGNKFGKPSNLNAETWFTASEFLGYSSGIQVVRVANTTSNDANAVVSAYGNTAAVGNVYAQTILNRADFESRAAGSFDANVMFVAKYPGALGNSLILEICDSANAFSSNLNLVGTQSGNNITATLSLPAGSNTVTAVFTSDGVVGAATTYANTILGGLGPNDLFGFGNTTVGFRKAQINRNSPAVTSNATAATLTFTLFGQNTLAVDWNANTTVNGNTSVINLNRSWHGSQYVSTPPQPTISQVNQGGAAATVVDMLHVVVYDGFAVLPGSFASVGAAADAGSLQRTARNVVEVWSGLSRSTDAVDTNGTSLYYRTVINNNSKYLWVVNDRPGAVSNTAANMANSTNSIPLRLALRGGQDGVSEANVSLGTVAGGYDLFADPITTDVSLIMQGKPIGGAGKTVNGYTVNNYGLANYIIDNIVTVRKDAVAFISPDDNMAVQNVGNEQAAINAWADGLDATTYAVLDTGYKRMYDRYNDVYRYVPMNGDIAGLCARTDQTNDAWWSPGGFNRGQIKNVDKLRWNPTVAQRDALYINNVNPIVTFLSPPGTYLFGDKTFAASPSAFDRINVRRLFNVLEKAISKAARYSLFEFNDEFTRAQFKNMVVPYLRNIQGRRGITDFLVVCDGTNNTANVIDNNRFVGDIYIKPNRSINFIQLNFVAVGTGVDFNTVIGAF